MYASDVMTSSVVTAGADDTILEIVRLMLDHKISVVPILDSEARLVGIVSEGDLMRRPEFGEKHQPRWWLSAFRGAVSLAEDFVKSHGMKTSEIMTRDPVTVREDTPLWEIAATLEKRKIKCVPVVRDDRVVGIVSRANLLQALTAQRGKAMEAPSTDDRTIREALISILKDERWSDMTHLNIVVKDRVVHVWGLINTESQRDAVRVAAETVPGVSEVVDHSINASTLTGSY